MPIELLTAIALWCASAMPTAMQAQIRAQAICQQEMVKCYERQDEKWRNGTFKEKMNVVDYLPCFKERP